MNRILVPCDFSTPAQQAYTFALDIAKKNNGEVYVLYVIDIPFMYDPYNPEVTAYLDPVLWNRLEEDAVRNFKEMKSAHSRQYDVTFRTARGPVTAAILDFIKAENISQVVMGTHGASGFAEYLIGSNTEKVVRFSKVPVLAVRRAVNLSSIKNILVPTTLNLNQTNFITELRKLQAFFDAQLHLLVVNTPHNMRRTKDQRLEMEEYAKHYKLTNFTLNTRDGFSEEEEILGFVKDQNADMIAMATHGRTGLARLFSGSVTEAVVNHVGCPIWTYSLAR